MIEKDKSDYKMIVIGPEHVGKTSIINRLQNHEFVEKTSSTIGCTFCVFHPKYSENVYQYDIWDLAGNDRYRNIVPMYYRNCGIILFVYSCKDSLYQIENEWIPFLQKTMDHYNDCLKYLIKNKNDIISDETQILNTKGFQIAQNSNMIFMKTSAKTGQNIHELFLDIDTNIKLDTPSKEPMIDLTIDDEEPIKDSCMNVIFQYLKFKT